ncbi:MAG TPA: diacylglycerol kinase family protein [Solirubrobacteraceae bacterium]|nr:diacylglycerol kinase family protein [Solirubrobacteraceae bacterium]
MSRRLAALAAIVLLAVAAAGAVALAVASFPRGLLTVAFVAAGAILAWEGVLRRGPGRWVRLIAGVLLILAAIVALVWGGPVLGVLGVVVALLLSFAAAKTATIIHVHLPAAEPPKHAVLFWNPRSGGGKAERFNLPDEARKRGIEPIELKPGDDLDELVRSAIAGGADGLAMAGGDGSQAIVATHAAREGLPYACIPAGTRNHFALDLGVDREDVIGALDAFVGGGERLVDLAEVNGRVFVNNVSLGLYAEAVQQEGYRDAKLRTIFETIPSALGPESDLPPLRYDGPDGVERSSGAALLISNDAYRLGAVSTATRPRLDEGVLGIAVFGAGPPRPVSEWTEREFEVRCDRPVAAGIDGEALVLDPPLHFVSRPGVLRARIAPQHPGASPSAVLPDSPQGALGTLARIATGREVPVER